MANDPHQETALNPGHLWKTVKIEENKCLHWQAGPLNLWIKTDDGDWLIAEKKNPEELSATCIENLDSSTEESLEWKRWVFNKEINELELSPTMPDRPLVIEARMQSNLPPGVEADFYVSIPLWVKLSIVKDSNKIEMQRIASTVMSNTWFGDNFEGELCYSLKSRAVRELGDIITYPHRAICPIKIKNDSETALPIQKICLRVKHLNIYADSTKLWTNKVKVTFRGDGLNSRIDYGKKSPEEAENATLIQSAEEEANDNLFQTFSHNIRNIF